MSVVGVSGIKFRKRDFGEFREVMGINWMEMRGEVGKGPGYKGYLL